MIVLTITRGVKKDDENKKKEEKLKVLVVCYYGLSHRQVFSYP